MNSLPVPIEGDGPGHRVTIDWMGEEVETLDDLLREGLRAVAVGVNPTPGSVAAGHYYQGNVGQRFFQRLPMAGVLSDGDGFEDDRSFAAGVGFTDIVKRPTFDERGVGNDELEYGRRKLKEKLDTLDVPLVVFVFKSAAETMLDQPLPAYFYGLVPRRRLSGARLFVMAAPYAANPIVADAARKLKRSLRRG
jgi:TDG/mug DNA glycosylase family protein